MEKNRKEAFSTGKHPMTIYSIIVDELAATTSVNNKLEILLRKRDNKLLSRVFEMALNPFHNYWIKKIPELDNTDTVAIHDGYISLEYGLDFLSTRLALRVVTGNAAILELKELLENMFIEDQEIICRILERDMKCGVSIKTANKIWKGLIPEFPVMLCSKNDEKTLSKMRFPAIVQKKEDGGRLLATITDSGVTYHSRNGKPLDLLDAKFTSSLLAMREQIDHDFVLDGELLLLDEENGEISNRQTGNGIMTKAVRGTLSVSESARLLYTVWDMIPMNDLLNKGKSNVPYEKRFNELTVAYLASNSHNNNNLRMVDSLVVDSLEKAEEAFQKMLAAGHEGIILKDPTEIYEGKRVKHQIKFKAEKTADLKIVGIIRGTGKNEKRMGAIELETSCGGLFVGCGTGFSDDEREWFWKNKDTLLGGIVEVKYNEVIQDKNNEIKSLFLPVYVSIRTDKMIANSLEELN